MQKIAVFLAAFYGVCSLASAEEKKDVYFPILEFGQGFPPTFVKCGFIDNKGAVVFPPTEDIRPSLIMDLHTLFAEGLQPIQKKTKPGSTGALWGYFDTKFNVAIAPQFSLAYPFSEELAVVRDSNGMYGYIDHSGNYVIAPQFSAAGPFSDGMATAMKPDGWLYGFIDKSGKWVVPPKFPSAEKFSEGLACVAKYTVPRDRPPDSSREDTTMVWGYIDKNGQQVIDFKFQQPSFFHEGLAAINDVKQGCGYIDKQGTFVIPQKFFMGWEFSEGVACVKPQNLSEGEMSFINHKGEEVFKVTKGSFGHAFSDGLACVSVEGPRKPNPDKPLFGYVDHTGSFVIKPQFQQASDFYDGIAQVSGISTNYIGMSGYIDKAGTFIWKREHPLPR